NLLGVGRTGWTQLQALDIRHLITARHSAVARAAGRCPGSGLRPSDPSRAAHCTRYPRELMHCVNICAHSCDERANCDAWDWHWALSAFCLDWLCPCCAVTVSALGAGIGMGAGAGCSCAHPTASAQPRAAPLSQTIRRVAMESSYC